MKRNSSTHLRFALRALFALGVGSLALLLLQPSVVSAASSFSTMTNSGGLSPRGKVCDTWNVSGVSNGSTITIELKGAPTGNGTLGDPYLHVFDSSNVQKGANDDGGSGLNSKLSIRWYSGYYIGASVYSSGLNSTYTLQTSAGSLTKATRSCGAPAKSNQTISFTNPGTRTYGTSFGLSASASSGLAVSFSSSTTAVCTVSGSTVTTRSTGTCSITASQGGNSSYNAAPNVTQSFSIAKASQSITFGTLSNRTYGSSAFGISATATSGLSVTFTSQTSGICSVSGSNVTMLASGTCTIRASQSGSNLYNAATAVDRSFSISKASQSITYSDPGQKVSQSDFVTSATATSGLAVSFTSQSTSVCTTSGSTVDLVGVGTCTIRASQSGDSRYLAAPNVDRSFTVVPANQSISFDLSSVTKTYGDADFAISATASSALGVAFTSNSPGVCAITGSTVEIRSAGTCSVTASQGGNSVYNAAASVTETFSVAPRSLTAPNISIVTRVYNGTRTAGSVNLGSISGLVGSEQLVITPSAGDYGSEDVGGQTSTVSFSLANGANGGVASNYVMASVNVSSQISARPLVVTTDDVTRTADDSSPSFSVSTVGLVSGESVTGSTFSFVTVSAGSLINGVPDHDVVGRYTVAPASITLANGRPTSNYSITFLDGAYEVSAGEAKKLLVPSFSGSAPSGRAFSSQPVVTVADAFGNRIISGDGSQALVSATIVSGANGSLVGSTTATAEDGSAQFSSLGIAGLVSETYTIEYSTTVGGQPLTAATQQVSPSHGYAVGLSVASSVTAQVASNFPSAVDVDVLDAEGNTVLDSAARITVVSSGGQLDGTTTVTASNGTASFGGLTLNATVGTYTLTYSSPGLTSATQSASVQAGPAAQMSLSTRAVGTRAGESFTTAPALTITDAAGNPVLSAGSTVTATVTQVNGTGALLKNGTEASSYTALTDANGIATFTGLGIVGLENTTYTITFSSTVNGVTIPAVRQSITVTQGPAHSLAVTRAASGASAGQPTSIQPRIEVLDRGGNRVTALADQIMVSAQSSTATVSATGVSSVAGFATFTDLILAGAVGSHTIQYDATVGGASISVSQSIALTPGSPASLDVTREAATAASGEVFGTAPIVRVRDAFGNLVTDSSTVVTASITSGTGSLIGVTTRSVVGGAAEFVGLGLRGTVGVFTIEFSSANLVSDDQTISLTHGSAARLSVATAASGARAGAVLTTQPVVQVLDADGNLVTTGSGSSATVAVTASLGSTLTGTTSVQATGGVATFSGLRLDGRNGVTYSLTYRSTVGGATLTSTSHGVTMSTGDPAALRLVRAASGTRAGEVFTTQPQIEIIDVSGNLVTSSSDTVTVSASSGATLINASGVQASSGVATFGSLGISGTADTTYTITFGSGSLTTVTQLVRVTPGAPASLHLLAGASTEVGSGAALSAQPQVEIRDSAGNRVTDSSAVVTASVSGGATFVGASRATAVSGLATFSSLGLTGTADSSQTITFSSGALTSTSYTVTVRTGSAVKLSLDTPASSTGQSGVAFGTQPVVSLRDTGNNVVTTSAITITASASSGVTLSSSTSATSQGVATFAGLAATAKAASYTITYTASGLTPVSQQIAVSPGNPARVVVDPQAKSVRTNSGEVLDLSNSVRIVDSAGNTVDSSNAQISITATTPQTATATGTACAPVYVGESNGKKVYKFTSTAGCNWVVPKGVSSIDILAVGGGGGGGSDGGGGGGGGELMYHNSVGIAEDTQITIDVGAGGDGAVHGVSPSTAGGATTLAWSGSQRYSVEGGSRGLLWQSNAQAAGGSGGTGLSGAVFVQGGQGGGDVLNATGGGCPASGVVVQGGVGSNGPLTSNSSISGVPVRLGGGGGGGAAGTGTPSSDVAGQLGGEGGGGSGASYSTSSKFGPGQPGSANTGGGGGGGAACTITGGVNLSSMRTAGGDGADGVVYIAYSSTDADVSIKLNDTDAVGNGSSLTVNAASGIAPLQTFRIDGRAYDYTLTYSSSGLAPDTQTVRVESGTPSKIVDTVVAAGSRSGNGFITQPVVAVQDAVGNLVASSTATVSASVIGSNVALSGTTQINAVSGIASFTDLVLTGTAGTYTLEYSADLGGGNVVTTSASVLLEAGSASKLLTNGTSSVAAGGTISSFSVEVADASDNTVGTAIVDVGVEITSGPSGVLSGSTTVSAVSGVATFSDLMIGGTAGTYTLTFRSDGLTATTRTVEVSAGADAYLDLVQFDSEVPSGATMSPSPLVVVRDAYGNQTTSTTGITATLRTNTVGGVSTGSLDNGTNNQATANASNGQASFSGFAVSGRADQQYLIEFSASGLTPISGVVTVSAGTPTALAVVQAAADATSSLTLGVQPIVELRDSGDNVVAASTDTVSITSSTLTVGGGSVSAVSGVATFAGVTVSGSTAVSHNVTYSATVNGSTITTSQALSLDAGAPSAVVVTTGADGGVSGDAFTTQPVLEIQDTDGNRVTAANGSVSVAVSGTPTGTRVGDVLAPIVAGRASFGSLGLSGRVNTNYTLTYSATVGASSFTTSEVVTVSAGVPATIALTTAAIGTESGAAFTTQPVITVYDEGGNESTGTSVTVSATVSVGGALVGTTTATTSAGVATFTDLGLSGIAGNTYRITFTAAGLPVVTQDVTVSVGPPSDVVITRQAAGARSGDVVSTTPKVMIVDSGGNQVTKSGVTVSATISAGGSLTGSTTLSTDGNGEATFTDLVVNGSMGTQYTITFGANDGGVTLSPDSQTIRAQLGSASQVALVNTPIGNESGVTFTTAPVLEIQDAGGNVIADSTATITASVTKIDGSVGGVLEGTTSRQAVGGASTFSGLGISGVDGQTYRITFSSGSLASTHHDVTVSTGPATRLVITSATPTASAGVAFDPAVVVEIRDSGHNTVASTAQIVASVNEDASLVGTTVVAAVNGVATFGDLGVMDTAGDTPTVTFAVAGVGTVTQQVSVTPGPAAKLAVIGENAARVARSGSAFDLAPKIRIEDAGGNLIDDDATVVTATITQISVGGVATGVLVGTTAVTTADGVATFSNLGISGRAGRSYEIRYSATVNGQNLSVASEIITVTAGDAVALELTRASVGTAVGANFTIQPIVTVLDSGGNVIPSTGLDVLASVSAGGSLVGNVTVSASTGSANFTDLGIIGTAGSTYTITYTAVNGATPAATISAVSQQVTPRVGVPARLELSQSIDGAASATPFTQQPIVTVVDAGGNTVTASNASIVATVAPILVDGVSTGALSGTATIVAADGVARFTDLALTGKSDRDYTITFTAASLPVGSNSVTQIVRPTSGAADSLGIVTSAAGAPSGSPFATQPEIEILDSAGNRALGSSRRVSVTVSSGGTLVGTSFADAVLGLVQFGDLGLTGTAGSSYTLTFASGNITSVTQSVVVEVGPPTRLVLTRPPSGAAAGSAYTTQPIVEIRDSGDNLVSSGGAASLEVVASVDSVVIGGVSTGVAVGDATVSATGGVAAFSDLGIGGRAGVAYTARFSASNGGQALISATETVTPTFGSAAALSIEIPASGAIVGERIAVQPKVAVIDAFDNVVADNSDVVVASISDGATLLGSTSRAATSGRASYTDLEARGVAGTTATVSYQVSGLPTISQSLPLLAGSPTRLVVDQAASGATSGDAFTTAPRIVIADRFGNRTTSNATISASITQVAGSGVLTGTTQVAATNGAVTFADLGLDGRAGTSYTLRFSSIGLAGTSQTIQVDLGRPATIELVRRSVGGSVGSRFAQQPTLVVKDAGDNVLTSGGVTVSASVDEPGGSLIGNTTVTTSNGYATFTDIGLVGTNGTAYTVRFTTGNVSTSQQITARTGSAESLQLSQSSAGFTNGASFTTQPRVSLRDAGGNLVMDTGASVEATLLGTDGSFIGTTTRPFISGVAAFTNLGIEGIDGETYEIVYSSDGLTSVTESATISPALPGLVPQFATVSATVDGFRVDMINDDANFSVTAVASSGGRVSIVDLGGGVRRFIVSGVGPDAAVRLAVTTSRAGHTTETAVVDGRSQLRAGLVPELGTPTVTNDGFYVQIENYNSGFVWTAETSAGGRTVISPSGRLTVTGLTGGVAVSATVTTSRAGYQSASATTSLVTTRQAAYVPTFDTPVSLTGGFTVQVTNYDANYSYATFVTPGGTASIDGSGLVTVTDLPNGTAATVLVTTSRTGYSNGSAAVLGRSLGAALTPVLGAPVATTTGWTVGIGNYDADFTWSASATSGTASISVVDGSASVIVEQPSASVTITVSTSRPGYLSGTASIGMAESPGLAPRFGSASSAAGGFTVPIVNFDSAYTWTVSSSAVAEIDGAGTVTVSATSASVTVTTTRLGHASRSATFTKGSNPALVPALATVSASNSGFVVEATNFDASYDWSFVVSKGSATRSNDRFVVSGLAPGESAELVVYTDKSDHDTGNASITVAATANAGLTPTFGSPTSTADGFTVQVTNYDSAYSWQVLASYPADVGIDGTGLVTVRQIEGGESSTVTVLTSRQGYDSASAEVTGTASTGGGLLALFAVPEQTADGFRVQVSNHNTDFTWNVTTSAGSVSISPSGLITVTGLSAGESATVSIETSRSGRTTRTVDFVSGALNGDGSSNFLAGRVPTFGPVTPTSDGFRVSITNHSSNWTWSAVSARGMTVAISSSGVLTVSGLSAGLSDSVTVTSDASGYSSGTALVSGTALEAGTRASNLLSSVTMTALCPHGSPDGEGVVNVNDLQASTRFACYTAASKTPARLASGTIGFHTGDVGTVVLDSITFTSAADFSERDPLTYSLWGCQAANQYCSVIVSNDSTGLSTTRGADSTRTFRNTRAFNYYRVTFGSMRSTSNVLHIGEVSFGGTSGLPAGLVPTFGTPTVGESGFTVQVTNFSKLYTWSVSVPSPGRAAIDATGTIRVENLAPNQVHTLTVTTQRSGFSDGTGALTVSTRSGSSLVPSITAVQATEDGLRALIENYDTPGFTWSVSVVTVSAGPTASAGVVSVTDNGIVTVTGATAGATIRLTATTSRSGYLDGSNYVDVTVLNDLGLITFASPTPLDSGFTVQISNYTTSDANGSFEWRAVVNSGAVAAIDNSGLITVSNLGSGSEATVIVTRSQSGGFSTSGSVVGRSVGILTPEFGPIEEVEDGFVVDIANFDPAFTWAATVSAGTAIPDWGIGRVTVSAVPLGSSATLTVSASRTGYLTGTASTGPSLAAGVVPEFSAPTGVGTGFTTSITNWASVSATTWSASVAPAGTVSIDGSGNVTVTGAVRGAVTTVTVTTQANGRLNGRGTVTYEVGARSGLTPSFGTPLPIVEGFTVQVANFNPDFEWTATASDGASASVSSTGLVTVTGVPEATSVTVTVGTSRAGYQSASATVTGSSRARPGLIPQFGTPVVSGDRISVQIDNYDPDYEWSATVDNGGLVSISSAGRLTVTDLPGFTMATIVVTTTRAGFADQTGTMTATTRAGRPLVPQFAISTSTIDGFVVRIRNFDLRYDWFVSSPLSGVVGSISVDGVLTVSGATTGALVPIEVRTERSGFQSGFAEFSAVARPVVANTIGALQIQQYRVTSGVATVSTSAVHGLEVGDWVVIVNLSSVLDGEHRVASVPNANQFTFTTAAADTASTASDVEESTTSDVPEEPSDQGESDNPQPPVDGEEPIADEPVADDPVAEDPVADDPVAEDPVADEPVADDPVADEPVADEPIADAPAADDPVADEPIAEEPETTVSAQNQVSVQAWVTPSQPAFVQRSETTVEVTLSDDDASTPVTAIVTIPSLVGADGTSMSVIAAMTEETAAGYRMVRIDGTVNGQDVTRLDDVIRILFEPPATGAVPVSSSDDGITWTQLALLNSPNLPDGVDDGYYVNDDGTVWIFTRHLSFFGMLAEQAVPLDIVGVPSPTTIGDVATLTVEGGEGDGAVSLTSLTPSVCSVDDLGGFQAVASGTCTLRAVKSSSGRYLEATAIESYTIVAPTSNGGGSGGGGGGSVPGDDADDTPPETDDGTDGVTPEPSDPADPVDPPEVDAPSTRPGPSRPTPGSTTDSSEGTTSPEDGVDDSSADESSTPPAPPSQEVIDAVGDEARLPLPPGEASPPVDAERPVVVIEDGEIVEVDVEPTPEGDGLVIRGDGFEVLVRGTDSLGNPLNLSGDLRLIIEKGRSISVSGEGYAPRSIVAVFLYSTPYKLGEVETDAEGRFSAEFSIPSEIEDGDHTVQVNGVSPEGDLRTVNIAVEVVDPNGDGSRFSTVILIVVGATLVVIVTAGIVVRRRRRRSRSVSEPDASS